MSDGLIISQDLAGEGTCTQKKMEAWPEKATKIEDKITLPERARTDSSPEPEPAARTHANSLSSEPEPGPPPPGSPACEPADEPQAVPPMQQPSDTPKRELPSVARNARFRKSCYFQSTLDAGVLDWCTYNHMLLPSRFDWYKTPDEEYEHLKTHVCIWDVAAERQVELVGPDAVALIEFMTPRPMGDMAIGQCRYAIIIDNEGMVLNDPVVSRLADDRFWLSGADSDLILWAKALAIGRSLNVRVSEAAVSPVALQGPKSPELLADLFGDWIYDLKYFKFKEVELDGMPIALARSGWSPEVGYELYLQDESRGNELWQRLMEAGKKYCLKPGTPNQKRRIEGGMLNFGSDITPNHSILELGLPPSWVGAPGKAKAVDFIGKEFLHKLHEEGGAKRRVVGVELSDKQACPALSDFWEIRASAKEDKFGATIGNLTSLCFSPYLDAWIGIATVSMEVSTPDTEVCVEMPDGPRSAVVRKLPFMPRVAMLPRAEASTA